MDRPKNNLVTFILNNKYINKNIKVINKKELILSKNINSFGNASENQDQLSEKKTIINSHEAQEQQTNISIDSNSIIQNGSHNSLSNDIRMEQDDTEDKVVDEDYSLLIHDSIVLFSCRHCHLAYETYVLLKDHCVIEHGVFLQRKDCQHCLQVMQTHTSLLQHLKQSHLSILSAEQADKLNKKFPLDSNPKNFVCDKCHKVLSSKASLLTHIKKFHSPNESDKSVPDKDCPLECVKCDIKFENFKELTNHHNTTHSTKVYFCMDCDSSFQTRSSLNLHNIYHHRVHRCFLCLIFFQGRLGLTNHVKELHPGMPVYRADSRFVCEYCSECFSVRSQLSDHIQSSHLGKINQCEDCGKVLATSETLKVHRLKHRPDKHRTCEHCGKQFYRTGMLTEHIRASHPEVLSDEWRQRTTCPYCQARFTRRESMRRHIDAKHEHKQYVCNFCQRPFTCRRYLVRHENKHHLGKPSS